MRITRRSRARGIARPIDFATVLGGLSPPEKQWCSIAIVSTDPEVPPVEFSREDGQVYVNVVLQPSMVPVRARLGGQIAGAGEGEYFPFLAGDEVMVLLPEGREDAGAVVVARLSNRLDAFPMDSVAGQDPTTNSFAFRRRRTPHLEEFAGPITFRNALTGALFSLDSRGGITLKDGENSTLQISADAATLQGPSDEQSSPRLLLQLNFTEERALLQVGDAQLLLNSSKTGGLSYLTVPGDLTVAFGNSQPAEHVMTLEAFLGILDALFNAVGILAPASAAIASIVAVGGGALSPAMQTALATGLAIAGSTPKPPPGPSGVQINPGLGAVRFHTG